MHATSAIAEFVVKSRWEECPAPAVEAARRAILDCLGVKMVEGLDGCPDLRSLTAVLSP